MRFRVGALTAFAVLFLRIAAAGADQFPLTVKATGTDSGYVQIRTSDGADFACSYVAGFLDCPVSEFSHTPYITSGAVVTVSAAGSDVRAAGLFSGTGPTAGCDKSACRFTMTGPATLHVDFSAANGPPLTLTIGFGGDGLGSATADVTVCQNGGAGPATCTLKYLPGTTTHLLAVPASAVRFVDFTSSTGAMPPCAALTECDVTLTASMTIVATFRALASLAVTPGEASGVIGGPAQPFAAVGTFTDGVSATIAPGTSTWIGAPPLPAARQSVSAAVLDGRIYATGGQDNAGTTATVTAYDPAAGAWTTLASMATARIFHATATAGGYLYALGGSSPSGTLASVERYDPAADAWTAVAPLSAPRIFLAAATVDGVIYVAGGRSGGTAYLNTVEAYDPATDTWTTKAPMPTAGDAAGAVVNGVLYVAVRSSAGVALHAYDAEADTWATKAPPPVGSDLSAASVDGILYLMGIQASTFQRSLYAYDPVLDTWSARTAPPSWPTSFAAITSLGGAVYSIGGGGMLAGLSHSSRVANVDMFTESLHWSSSAPSIASITQDGLASPLGAGTAIIRATAGTVSCTIACATFSVSPGPTQVALDVPASNSVISGSSSFSIAGWAINRSASSSTGVDAVHVYAFPSGGGSAIFLGAAEYGTSRGDIGALYGSQFTDSGYLLETQVLAAGTYTITAYAHDALSDTFDASASATITVVAPVSNPAIAVDTPAPGQTVTSAFEVFGWALDQGAPTGTGVDSVQFYVQPQGQPAPGVFVGTGTYGFARPDLAAIYGSRFTNVGYHFTVTGLSPGSFTLNVYARSTVTNSYSIVKSVPITVSATALMSIDAPSPETAITASTFVVGGWSIDRSVESTTQSGSGVDTLHVYAYPNPGSGQPPIFLGVASVGVSRPDVGAAYGSRYDTSGYQLLVDRTALGLAPGLYGIVVHSHSAVSGTFNNDAVVWVRLQ